MGNSKKNRHSAQKNSCNLGDVTLNDFANAAISGKTRLKKPVFNHDPVVVDVANVWDAESSYDELCLGKKFARRKNPNSKCKESGSKMYPLSIWCVLSRYISPEDIGHFAGICSASNFVVNSSSFWFSLYKRYYKPVKNMPERLQPDCMTRLYELKSCVIRALYYMYPPFASKYYMDNFRLSASYHPSKAVSVCRSVIVQRRCISVWSKSEDNHWQCNFIFKRQDLSVTRVKLKKTVPDLLATLNNIHANKADGCVMLQVIYRQFTTTPQVMGSILTSLKCNRNTLKMTFSPGISASYNPETVTFNAVEVLRVHNWWSPRYPHSNGFSSQIFSCT